MATARVTATALLSTINEVASTATSLIGAVGTGAKMLNSFADNAHWEQTQTIEANKNGFKAELSSSVAMRIIKAEDTLSDYIAKNPTQADRIQQIVNSLNKSPA